MNGLEDQLDPCWQHRNTYHFLPYKSAATPKSVEPIDRNISTKVIPQVISAVVLPNVSDRSVTVRETLKKSTAIY